MDISNKISVALYDMMAQDYDTPDDIAELLKNERGRAYVLHALIDHAINGDGECIKLTYQLIDKMEKGVF